MGPHCKHCGKPNCLISFPSFTPKEALEAYGSTEFISTCRQGQAFEKEKYGWCISDIMEVTKAKDPALER